MTAYRWLWITVVLGVAACGDRVAREYRAADSVQVAERAPKLFAQPAAMRAYTERPVDAAAPALTRITMMTPAANLVIRMGDARVQVDSLDAAIAQVQALAQQTGGYVAGTTLETGRGQPRSASLELKIPAERFQDALVGLNPIGKLEALNVGSEDVGEEYVDVNARIENARRLEARLVTILAARTGRLKDVLEVEQALARVREEIERYEGRLRYLRAHTALSTLSVRLHEPVPVVGRVGTSVLGEAVKQAWRNFVWLVALGVQSLGVLIPLGAVAALAWVGVRRWRAPLLRAGA
jgi:hypothetical protein